MLVMEVDDALGKKDNSVQLIEMLQREQKEAADIKVPWFLEMMPSAYFKQVEPELRNQHLQALVALYDFDAVPELTLNSPDGSKMTMISPGFTSPKRLVEQLDKLPSNAMLNGMSVFNSVDREISLNIFEFLGSAADPAGTHGTMTDELREYLKDLMAGNFVDDPLHPAPAPYFAVEEMERFVHHHCSEEYVSRSSPRRFCKQVALYKSIMTEGADEVGVDIEANWNGKFDQTMVTLGITNVLTMAAIKRLGLYFQSKGLSIVRVHLDLVKGPTSKYEEDHGPSKNLLNSNTVSMFRILIEPHDPATVSQQDMARLNKRLKEDMATVSKWIDSRALGLVVRYGMSARKAEVLFALCDLTHAILAPKDAYEFARSNVEAVTTDESRIDYTEQILDLFLRRFDPRQEFPEREDAAFNARVEEIRTAIRQSGELEIAQQVFSTMLDVVKGTYRTNVFVPDRFGVSLRLDPAVCVKHLLDGKQRTEVPHGIFFVHGRRFAGFHVRFRDISRGGLRVVTPRNSEMHGVESARQLQECYDLAFAQQLKNKDIAEGGSKAVCLVDRHGIDAEGMDHIVRKSLKAMVNSVLDLITSEPQSRDNIVDHMGGVEEFIYFGPDEQVTPEHINWIVERAEQRSYAMPSAFMSSKPDAGINHKVYGVTSEGVFCFLDEALRSTGIDTSKPFTVKITGGPDGDVAGNMLKILHREYGENARVVGLADGTACLEDPDGINWEELLRMFRDVEPLAQFSRDKLGNNAHLHLCDTPKGINLRNTMHNRVVADAFVPGGGRPATINDTNWEKFLLPDGKPSSPLIVEGANLFLTPVARDELSKRGCVIVKDSSANKCGVICSSFEIIASMLLQKSEFLEIKDDFVQDVLDGLRSRAQREAQLMFREYKSNPSAPLPPVSERISVAINRSTDALADAIEKLPQDQLDRLMPIIRLSLPKALMDKAWDRFQDKVPKAYIHFQLACILASEIVYREGISYVMSISDEVLAGVVLRYAEQAMELADVADKVDAGLPLSAAESKLVNSILRQGGARTMIDHHLSKESEA
ncbi:NAD-specific glutamate dehydrogenase (NAD-GDH) [Durusdinium trenchii]|uniref:NAD-specific glutamate dehydrogenase (NAD-GDH) n=1 Tax=Durusdinium trenchii TaxID=1381693 RepID=A0ABP0J801_9DINO